jgi:hypothetical protein
MQQSAVGVDIGPGEHEVDSVSSFAFNTGAQHVGSDLSIRTQLESNIDWRILGQTCKRTISTEHEHSMHVQIAHVTMLEVPIITPNQGIH